MCVRVGCGWLCPFRRWGGPTRFSSALLQPRRQGRSLLCSPDPPQPPSQPFPQQLCLLLLRLMTAHRSSRSLGSTGASSHPPNAVDSAIFDLHVPELYRQSISPDQLKQLPPASGLNQEPLSWDPTGVHILSSHLLSPMPPSQLKAPQLPCHLITIRFYLIKGLQCA